MRTIRRILCAALLILATSSVFAPIARAQQPQTPEQQSEFVPVSEVPPEDRLPAAPMLIAAYSFALAAVFAYVLSISKRLGAVKSDIARLEADLKRGAR